MKKMILIICLLAPATSLYAQDRDIFDRDKFFGPGGLFEKPEIKGRGDSGSNSSGQGSSRSTPSSNSDILGETYEKEAHRSYEKGFKYWNKDWDKAEFHFKKAMDYDKSYEKIYLEAQARNQWDKGVKEASNRNWDKAIEHYKEALRYFNDEQGLKNNIIGCSASKTKELADKYYEKKNWIYAAAYYYVLIKNFDTRNIVIESRLSQCLSEISRMKKSEQGNTRYNEKVGEIKRTLPF